MLVIERVGDEQRAHDAADDVWAVDTGPEQDALEADDDRAACEQIGQALQRRLDDLKDEFRQRRRADVMAEAIEDGCAREEDHARYKCRECFCDALRDGIRHLDADVVLLAVAEDVGDEERNEDGGDDAVAARPCLRDDVADCLAALRQDCRRHQDKEGRQCEDGGHHGIAAFILNELVGDGQYDDECQHTERATCDGVQRRRPVCPENRRHEVGVSRDWQVGQQQEYRTTDGEWRRHDEAITKSCYSADLSELPHDFDKLIENLLFTHVLSSFL